jgi:hypothetical protein
MFLTILNYKSTLNRKSVILSVSSHVNSCHHTTGIWPRQLWIFFLSVMQQPNSGVGPLVVEVPRSHTPGRALLNEAATYRTHNKQRRRTSMLSARFEPAMPAIKQLQTYALDHTTACVTSGFSSPCSPHKTCS